MRILVSCANGSGTSLMMMRSVEKAMKELGVPITKFIIAPFQKEKALLANTTLFLLQSIFTNVSASRKTRSHSDWH